MYYSVFYFLAFGVMVSFESWKKHHAMIMLKVFFPVDSMHVFSPHSTADVKCKVQFAGNLLLCFEDLTWFCSYLCSKNKIDEL